MFLEARMGIRDKDSSAASAHKPLPLILLKRAAILFFMGLVLSLFFWIVGNYSYFLDETQAMLLGVLRVSSLLLISDSCLGELASLAHALKSRRPPSAGALLGYASAILLGAFGLLFSNGLILLSRGL